MAKSPIGVARLPGAFFGATTARRFALILLAWIVCAVPLAAAPVHPFWLPEQASLEGARIDRLFNLIFWITAVIFVAVEFTLLFFLVRYRRQEGKAATYTAGNHRLEIVWTVIPALILVILAVMSRSVWSSIKGTMYEDSAADARSFQVMVMPEQFRWNITYPGADGHLGTADDVAVLNQLHLPLGRDILVRLRSKDVIHSFFLPEMRIKQDALPNNWIRVRFHPVKTGKWEIVCAELCGLGHYQMHGTVIVEPETEVRSWLAEQTAKTASAASAAGEVPHG